MKSCSVSRIIANHANQVREAAIVASAQRASDDIRLLGQSRLGGGRMALTGPYTGEVDTEVEVEVVDGTVGALRHSAPVIKGVGNGLLAIDAVDISAEPDRLSFTLADAGTPAKHAVLDFFGSQLAARVSGEAGNAVSIMVTANLTVEDMPYATLSTIPAGMAELEGAAWNWGQPPAAGAGIPPTSLRVKFEGFPQVHRAWKSWRDGQFFYHLDPLPAWDIPADTRVQAVSGDYILTVTDGVRTEVYEQVVTVFDFLSALRARSALVEVRGAIAQDMAAGGMAVTDIPLRTDAHALPETARISSGRAARLLDVSVSPSAPTENIVIECLGAGTRSGAEVWSVTGGVSGRLPDARTGVPYVHAPLSFTVPSLPRPPSDAERISGSFGYVTRQQGEGLPGLCLKPLLLGAQARNKTVTFRYERKPDAACSCKDLPPLPVSKICLGLTSWEDGMSLEPEYLSRLQALYSWRASFFMSNTSTGQDARAIRQDLDFADDVTVIFADALWQVQESADALAQWDSRLSAMQSELMSLAGMAGTAQWPPLAGTAINYAEAVGAQVLREGALYKHPSNGHYYRAIAVSAMVTGPVPDDTSGGQVAGVLGAALPGDLSWFAPVVRLGDSYVSSSRQTAHVPKFGAHLFPTDGGATSMSYIGPRPPTGNIDGPNVVGTLVLSVTYQDLGAGIIPGNNLNLLPDEGGGYAAAIGQLVRRYAAQMDAVLAIAGVIPSPKSDASGSGAGDGCWRDVQEATHWWVDTSGEYLPVFTNHPYVSARRDADGSIVSTQEFGFGLVTKCESRLRVGDTMSITINGAGNGAYTAGDRFVIPVVAAHGAAFVGGEESDPTQTWSVRSELLGALPDWLWRPDAPSPYLDGPIHASLTAGAIPFEVGDTIAVALEGGRLRWRRDGGAWVEGDLYNAAHDLGDGLELSAMPGAAPSFVAEDRWLYQAVATYGVSRLRQPRVGEAYAWDGDAAVLDVDFGSAHEIEAVLLALHTLPADAEITLQGGATSVGEWTLMPVWSEGAILAPLPEVAPVRYLRLSITGAGAGASIGWLWAGLGWRPTVGASELTMVRQYGMARGKGRNAGGLYRGRGMGAKWAWRVDDGGGLFAQSAAQLVELVDHVAEQGVEPLCLVPDVREPLRASIALLDADEIDLRDDLHWQYAAGRFVGVELPFRAVLT